MVPLQQNCLLAGPILGPFSGPLFRMYPDFLSSAANHMQANATLQLDRFLAETCCPEGKTTLRINLDESSIRLWPGAVLGTIACKSILDKHQQLVTNISLRHQRGCASLIAIICDDNTIQKHLPQFLVVNERLVPMTVFKEWHKTNTHCLMLLRHRTAWLDVNAMKRILRELARSLSKHAPHRHYVLSMDTCPIHLTRAILREMAVNHLHFCPLAAQMTQWLQPLDVGVFKLFKQRLRELHQREQILHRQGELSVHTLLNIIDQATSDIIQNMDWNSVFRLCGLSSCPPTSQRFQNAVGQDAQWTFTNAIPTLEIIQAVLPKRKFVAVSHLFPLLLRPPQNCASETLPQQESDCTDLEDDEAEQHATHRPWWGRTRATSHRQLSQPLVSQHTASGTRTKRQHALAIATPRPPVPR